MQSTIDVGGLGSSHRRACGCCAVGGWRSIAVDVSIGDGECRTRWHECRLIVGSQHLVGTALITDGGLCTLWGSTLHASVLADHVHADDGGLIASCDDARSTQHRHGLGIASHVGSRSGRRQSCGHLYRVVVAGLYRRTKSCVAHAHLLCGNRLVVLLITCHKDGEDGRVIAHADVLRAGGHRERLICWRGIAFYVGEVHHNAALRSHRNRRSVIGYRCTAIDGNRSTSLYQCRCVAVAHADVDSHHALQVFSLRSGHRCARSGVAVGDRGGVVLDGSVGHGVGRSRWHLGSLIVSRQHLVSTALIADGSLCTLRCSTLYTSHIANHIDTDKGCLIGSGDGLVGGVHRDGLGVVRHIVSRSRRCQSCWHLHRLVIAHLLWCGQTRVAHAHLLRGDDGVAGLVTGDVDGVDGGLIGSVDVLRTSRHDECLVGWCGVTLHVAEVYHDIAQRSHCYRSTCVGNRCTAVNGNGSTSQCECSSVAVAHGNVDNHHTLHIFGLGSGHRSACGCTAVARWRAVIINSGVGDGECRTCGHLGKLTVGNHLVDTAIIADGSLCTRRSSGLDACDDADHIDRHQCCLIGNCGDVAAALGCSCCRDGLGVVADVRSSDNESRTRRYLHTLTSRYLRAVDLKLQTCQDGVCLLLGALVRGGVDADVGRVVLHVDRKCARGDGDSLAIARHVGSRSRRNGACRYLHGVAIMQGLVFNAIVHHDSDVGDVGLVNLVGVDADRIDIGRILHGGLHHGCAFGGECGDARCAVTLHVGEYHSHR